jgi:hypothetical protein
MNHKLLGIYLNDHLAGSTAGRDLAQRAAGSNRGTDYGDELEALAEEISEDRAVLEQLMDRLDIGVDRLKVAAAWAGEKAGRLKLNGSLTSYSPLSRLTELEALSLGVSGKQSLWKNLETVVDADPALAEFDLNGLAQRAQSQLDRLESLRYRAVAEALI